MILEVDRNSENKCRNKEFLDSIKGALDFDVRAYDIICMRLGHIKQLDENGKEIIGNRAYKEIGKRLFTIVSNAHSEKYVDRPISGTRVKHIYVTALNKIKHIKE